MTRYFDSHAHLTEENAADLQTVLSACREAGVRHIVDVGSNLDDSARCVAHAKAHGGIHAAVGVHPHASMDMPPGEGMERLHALVARGGVSAIGETGLDYHYDRDWREEQLKWFDAQLGLAAETGLPVIVHDREAHGDVLDVLKRYRGRVTGVLHCFSGSYEMAKQCIALGFYISFSGSVTFKNARRLQETAARLPLERLLIETDSPYLTPEPMRGRRPNQPAYVVHVAECLARLHGAEVEEVAETTYKNACALFGIRKKDGEEDA